jgi:hypothetical protein
MFDAVPDRGLIGINKGNTAGMVSADGLDGEDCIKVKPNPFYTSVEISVSRTSHVARKEVELEVFNIAGKMVANFKSNATRDERRATTCTWSPKTCPNGLYIIKARIGKKKLQKKITLIK